MRCEPDEGHPPLTKFIMHHFQPFFALATFKMDAVLVFALFRLWRFLAITVALADDKVWLVNFEQSKLLCCSARWSDSTGVSCTLRATKNNVD